MKNVEHLQKHKNIRQLCYCNIPRDILKNYRLAQEGIQNKNSNMKIIDYTFIQYFSGSTKKGLIQRVKCFVSDTHLFRLKKKPRRFIGHKEIMQCVLYAMKYSVLLA